MPQIQLDEATFNAVQRRASDAGYSSVDEYVADVLSEATEDETPNLDHLFTPELVAELDRINAEIDAGGKTYSSEEVDEHLARTRERWIQENSK
jgi:predicted lipid-binding transport protein (Tim44 family)